MSRQKPQRRGAKPKETTRKVKKKVSILVQERVDYIDYKDVNLLQRFMSDRSKVRARRVTGNDSQQQRELAVAIKNAREMALLPYTKRVAAARAGGGGGRDRRAEAAVEDAVETADVELEAIDETEEGEE
jgi:small subunit ribosomal protein S18